MSDESSCQESPDQRCLSQAEKMLVSVLLEKADVLALPTWLNEVLVQPLSDGGMGSLYFCNALTKASRRMGVQASEVTFKDEDGVDVVASLNLDELGEVFELDIWKTNFEALVRIPNTLS